MAVYTEVTDDELAALIASYGLGELMSYKGIAEGVENTNYLVHTSKGTFILTLYERRVAKADLPFFLGLLEHLSQRGVSCPLPVRNLKGEILSEIAGRTAAIVTFLEGVWLRHPRPEHCHAVGTAMAGLHLAGQDFGLERRNALDLAGCHALFARFRPQADEIMPGLRELIERELAFLDESWPQALPTGIIHADLFPDNVFFLGDTLSGLIDFYFACNDQLAYDIAIAINAWCFEPDQSFNPEKCQALLAGYRSIRRLEVSEEEALPVLLRKAALRFLITRAHDWLHTNKDALVKPHDPMDFVKRLRFHQSARDARAYGLKGIT